MRAELLYRYGTVWDDEDCTVKILDDIEKYHEDSLWYGGDVAVIVCGKTHFHIAAIGDVMADFYNADNELIDWVKDKNNGGVFGEIARQYYKDDKELLQGVSNCKIEFQNNNWWECYAVHDDKGYYDLMWCLDSSTISDAIDEVIECIPDIIKEYDF